MVLSNNEWDPLQEVVLGTSIDMEWFEDYKDFYQPGKVDQNIIQTTELELKSFQNTLESFNVRVLRPSKIAYAARDTILIIGDKVIVTPIYSKMRSGEQSEILQLLPKDSNIIYAPNNDDNIMFDAANIIKADKDILFLISSSGNIGGYKWLQNILGDSYKVHPILNAYSGSHIDSTIVFLQEGLVLLNGGRVTENHLPDFLKTWDKIWVNETDIVDDNEPGAASKWMALNMFSIDQHNVIIDSKQNKVRDMLDSYNINTHGVTLTHSRYLLGGPHCVTLDTIRSH
jgi:N-dimethylarginine dimethylaminohydrolase